MIGALTLVLLGFGAPQAHAQGLPVRDGFCVGTAEGGVRACIPTTFGIVSLYVDAGTVALDGQMDWTNLNLYVAPNGFAPGATLPQTPQDVPAGSGRIADDRRGGWHFDTWHLTACGAISVFEATRREDDIALHFIDLIGPVETLSVILADNSVGLDDPEAVFGPRTTERDFANIVSELRYLNYPCAVPALSDFTAFDPSWQPEERPRSP